MAMKELQCQRCEKFGASMTTPAEVEPILCEGCRDAWYSFMLGAIGIPGHYVFIKILYDYWRVNDRKDRESRKDGEDGEPRKYKTERGW